MLINTMPPKGQQQSLGFGTLCAGLHRYGPFQFDLEPDSFCMGRNILSPQLNSNGIVYFGLRLRGESSLVP